MGMTPDQIRAEYWKIHEQMTNLHAATVDRAIQMTVLRLLAENTALMAEMNDLLKKTLGMINVEKLALDLGEAVRIADGVPK